MKRKLPYLFFGMLFPALLMAQGYQPLTVSSGFNADIIANGVGSSTGSSVAVDDANYAFMSTDFQPTVVSVPPAYALPVSGTINSLATAGLSFQLAGYTGNNALQLPTINSTGTLAFAIPVSATKLYVMGATGSGTATLSAVVHFTDNTTQNISSVVLPDWFYSTAMPIAAMGFGRVNRANNNMESYAADPRLYQWEINILPANHSKQIESIQLTKTSSAMGIANILAVSAKLSDCEMPDPPVAVAQSLCIGSTVADLEAEGEPGAVLTWYASLTAIVPLSASAELESENYFVSQTIGTCESERAEVDVTIIAMLDPVVDPAQSLCEGATISDIFIPVPVGSDVNWYASMEGEDPVEGNVELEAGSYFVSYSQFGCESARTEVVVTIVEAPEPEVNEEQEFCQGATVSQLDIAVPVGANTLWYISMESEEPLAGNAELATGSYFVAHAIGDCESIRAEVAVIVNPAPDEPGGDEVQIFTPGETIAGLEITTESEAEVHWYVFDEDVYVEITADTELEEGMTYYVSQTIDGCTSEFLAVTVYNDMGTGSFDGKSFSVFPNPANTTVTVSGSSVIEQVVVINLLGQQVLYRKGNADALSIDVSSLAAGAYLLQIYSEGKADTKRIIKQ